jgi:hypothetical protein
MNEELKPLTPEFRADINTNIDKQIRELNACQNNALVNAHKSALNAVRMLISALPDGYPIPVERRKQ